MSAIDPRTPVVVGVGQRNQHAPADVARSPIDLLADAARAAEADSGAPLLARTAIVAVVAIGSWKYADPGAFLARTLGIEPRATAVSTVGGNSPLILVNELAKRIRDNDCDVVLIGGAEAMHTRWRARREPRVELAWDAGDDAPCSWVIGDDRPGSSAYEMSHLAVAPTMVYPLFETALRADLGHGVDEHQQYIAGAWSRFSEVAATNPNAWSQVAYSPEQIRTVSPDNRMVCFPYPKRMCSNIDVDQSAAVFLCSYEAAKAAGVADDKMVFLITSSSAHDHYFLTERETLAHSPAIREMHTSLRGAGVEPKYHDLYSCFPSAVEIARRALGLSRDDSLTVTGGLGFAGGPVNNYPTHGLATMVETLRADPGTYGLTSALGWYVTKHAMAIWSTVPPGAPFQPDDPQPRIDALPRREPAGLVDGEATVEATSVAYERDGSPSVAIVSMLTDDGRRALANTRDTDTMTSMTTEPWEGRRAKVGNDGNTNTLR